jgi:hypothetical protein
MNKSPPTLPLPPFSSKTSILKSTLFNDPDENKIANERLQGIKRAPEIERLKCVSAESTETEDRIGKKNREEREEEEEIIILYDSVEYNHRDRPSFSSSETLSIGTSLFPPHITFLLNDPYFSNDGSFPSNSTPFILSVVSSSDTPPSDEFLIQQSFSLHSDREERKRRDPLKEQTSSVSEEGDGEERREEKEELEMERGREGEEEERMIPLERGEVMLRKEQLMKEEVDEGLEGEKREDGGVERDRMEMMGEALVTLM